MNTKKIAKTTAGVALQSAGYGLKLAKWGLNVSEVVLNGAENLTNSFVNAPKIGIGKAVFDGLKKQTGKISDYLIKTGKKYCR